MTTLLSNVALEHGRAAFQSIELAVQWIGSVSVCLGSDHSFIASVPRRGECVERVFGRESVGNRCALGPLCSGQAYLWAFSGSIIHAAPFPVLSAVAIHECMNECRAGASLVLWPHNTVIWPRVVGRRIARMWDYSVSVADGGLLCLGSTGSVIGIKGAVNGMYSAQFSVRFTVLFG